eukprot:1284771-Pyramimonas_sp.AAC.1
MRMIACNSAQPPRMHSHMLQFMGASVSSHADIRSMSGWPEAPIEYRGWDMQIQTQALVLHLERRPLANGVPHAYVRLG